MEQQQALQHVTEIHACSWTRPQDHAQSASCKPEHWPFLTEGRGLSLARTPAAEAARLLPSSLIASRHRAQPAAVISRDHIILGRR